MQPPGAIPSPPKHPRGQPSAYAAGNSENKKRSYNNMLTQIMVGEDQQQPKYGMYGGPSQMQPEEAVDEDELSKTQSLDPNDDEDEQCIG